jgi:diacylglycerol O-acyltransferase
MLTSFLSDVPEPFSVERALLKRRRLRETAAPAAPAGKEERKGRAVVMALRALWMQLRGAAHSRGDERVMPYRTPPTPFRRATGPDRGYAVLSLPLARLRALRDRSGATINDIVLEISAAALRQYLAERDALPAQPLVASVPVALERGAGDVDAGNELSAINVALPTHLDDPAERLGFIRRSMYEGKRFLFSMPKAAIDAYTSLVLMPFAVSQMLGFGERIRPYWNVVVSNVPGPRETLYLHGSRLEYMYPCSVVFHGHALNITARGCGDQLNFGLVVCRDAVPDVQRIADHIAAAFERLDAAYAAGDPWP